MGLKKNGILFEMIQKTVKPGMLFNQDVLMRIDLAALKGQLGSTDCVNLQDVNPTFPNMLVTVQKFPKGFLETRKEEVLKHLREKLPQDIYELYVEPLEYDEMDLCIDPACFIVYGLIWNRRCRETLEQLLPEDPSYYEYYENSDYKGPAFESHFRAEDVWMARRLIGMLEKIRAQEEPGQECALLMQAVYAGYRFLRRAIKDLLVLTGGDIYKMLRNDAEDFNAMAMASQIIFAVLIAEDLDILLEWDYGWVVMASFLEDYEDEFYDDADEDDADTEEKYRNFLERFDKEFETTASLSELMMHGTEDQREILLRNILHQFHISERIFWEHGLTSAELQNLIHQDTDWTTERFWGALAAAQLCKYIREITQMYLEKAPESARFQEHISQNETQTLLRTNQHQKQEIERLQAQKLAMNKSLCGMEKKAADLEKKLQEVSCREQAQKQELAELRSFAFGLSQSAPADTDMIRRQERCQEWKNRKIVVVGGHDNWQGKLREMFPRWQFVGANQKSISADCLKGKSYIVCNTELLTHACYYKILASRSRDQKILYVHSNNLERCIQEMERQLM